MQWFRLLGAAVATWAFVVAPGFAGEIGKTLEVKAVKVSRAPTIDGKLNDAAWLEAALAGSVLSGFVTHTGDAIVEHQSVVYVAWDAQNLYIASKNHRSDMNKLVVINKSDGNIAFGSEDDNEFYFDGSHRHSSHLQFAWNPAGARWASNNDTSSWTVATSSDQTAWYAEAAIPWSTLGVRAMEDALFGFNMNGYVAASGQWMAWAPTYGMFAQPHRFGHLILVGPVQR